MTLPIISICFAVLALVFLSCKWAITFFQRRKFRLKHHCAKVPRGSLDPFLGLDRILRLNNAMKEKRYLKFSRQTFEEHGNTYTTKLLLRNQFCTADPENFKAVLSTQFVEFDAGWRRAKAFEPLGGTESVLTTEGKGWKHARAVLRPGMSQKLAVDYEALETHWGKLFNILPKNGETVDLQDLFFRFTMDSTTQFLFGEPMGCLAQATLPSTIVELVNSFEMSMSCAYRRTALGPLSYIDRNYSAEAERQHVITTRRFVDNMINEALTRYKENKSSKIEDTIAQHKSLFEILMETTSFPAMRDHLVTTFGAARDTTGTLLSQMWYEVSRHPDVFAKLKSEVDFVLAGQLPTADSLKKLPYMDQVMKETLRLWSPVPVTMRIANKDTTLPRGGGPDGSSPIFIAKGSEVLLSFNALHRRKDIWGQNADDFIPERWSSIDPGWSYLAFSNGPRICPGQRRALAEGAYITARLLQSVARVESRDELPFEEFMKVTMQNARGVLVGVFVE